MKSFTAVWDVPWDPKQLNLLCGSLQPGLHADAGKGKVHKVLATTAHFYVISGFCLQICQLLSLLHVSVRSDGPRAMFPWGTCTMSMHGNPCPGMGVTSGVGSTGQAH